jgi:hypothetical protein
VKGKGDIMGTIAMAVPLVPGKEDAWAEFAAQVTGPRKAEFDDFNTRHGITDHRSWLQRNPDGSSLVVVVIDGPGAETFMGEFATSDTEFDKWFTEKVADVHGIDFSAQPPPLPERKI